MVLEMKYDDKWVGVHTYPHLDINAYHAGMPVQVGNTSWPEITNRNYELFAKLAGVRGRGPEPLGIPQDVSDLANAMINIWDSDGHSHSHLSLAEFTRRYSTTDAAITDAAMDRLQGNQGLRDRQTYCAGGFDFTDYNENFDAERGVRIVFWFDN